MQKMHKASDTGAMKTVPSLVATSTVGVAVTGLALGKAEISDSRPPSRKRKAVEPIELEPHDTTIVVTPPPSRPGTTSNRILADEQAALAKSSSSTRYYPPQSFFNRPSHSRLDTWVGSIGRRSSLVPPEEGLFIEGAGELSRRDSSSSRNSWVRRFSTIPPSPRSSIGPDTPLQAISHSSSSPFLGAPSEQPAQLPPNKLVKRVPSSHTRGASGDFRRNRSLPQVPTLRRPATSHQRSATLLQRFHEDDTSTHDAHPATPQQAVLETKSTTLSGSHSRTIFRPFLQARPMRITKDRATTRSSTGLETGTFVQRVLPEGIASLVQPNMIVTDMSTNTQSVVQEQDTPQRLEVDSPKQTPDRQSKSPATAVEAKRIARRSFSMNFNTPASWIPRSGSIRGKKGSESAPNARRNSSAPVPTFAIPGRQVSTSHGTSRRGHRNITDPIVFQSQRGNDQLNQDDPFIAAGFRPRADGVDRYALSQPAPEVNPGPTSSQVAPETTRSVAELQRSVEPRTSSMASSTQSSSGNTNRIRTTPRTSGISDQALTLVDSDTEQKVVAGELEDDVDFQSDTVFDSLRSAATASVRDAMFDESPPSLNGHTKPKRISVQEFVTNSTAFCEGDRIVEEDEGHSTPIKKHRATTNDQQQHTPVRQTFGVDVTAPQPSPPNFSLAANHFGRLSLDGDEEDEDWTKDDEDTYRHRLSPPSSTLQSRVVSPVMSASQTDGLPGDGWHTTATSERPRSNLFDWAETTMDKQDVDGNAQRPRTAHLQQDNTGRGGRSHGRKGPTALHIRSQSVPVVADPATQREPTKVAPKFGTWGLGAKAVSEDWESDFEFDGDDKENEQSGPPSLSMHVPLSIQVAQAQVIGHVGQVREVCLLVDDLKRLRGIAKDRGLLDGSSAQLWQEADGIIALAVPDEEDLTLSLSPLQSPTGGGFGSLPQSPKSTRSSFFNDTSEENDERFIDQGYDAADVSHPLHPIELLNRHSQPSGFVYDGHMVRRQSVVLPEDNVFGEGAIMPKPHARDGLRPPQPTTARSASAKSSDVARTVMEHMHQHRSTSDPYLPDLTVRSRNKMPFDTTSLRDLVNRANVLSRTLAEIVRRSEGITNSPEGSPKKDREISPAFTRVFTDPTNRSPAGQPFPRSHSNNSILSGSMDSSPSRTIGQRMHMMAVS